MDIKTLETNLNTNNIYQNSTQFTKDVLKIFSNCRLYNQPQTVYYKCANELEEFITPHLNALNNGTLEITFLENKRPQQKGNRKKTTEKGK